MSRCTTPLSWAYCIASAACTPSRATDAKNGLERFRGPAVSPPPSLRSSTSTPSPGGGPGTCVASGSKPKVPRVSASATRRRPEDSAAAAPSSAPVSGGRR